MNNRGQVLVFFVIVIGIFSFIILYLGKGLIFKFKVDEYKRIIFDNFNIMIKNNDFDTVKLDYVLKNRIDEYYIRGYDSKIIVNFKVDDSSFTYCIIDNSIYEKGDCL